MKICFKLFNISFPEIVLFITVFLFNFEDLAMFKAGIMRYLTYDNPIDINTNYTSNET